MRCCFFFKGGILVCGVLVREVVGEHGLLTRGKYGCDAGFSGMLY